MKMNKKNIIISIILIFVLILSVGCKDKESNNQDSELSNNDNNQEVKENTYTYDGNLIFKGLEKEIEVPYNEIFKMESVTKEVKHISSSGEESTDIVKGVLLDTILANYGESQKNYSSIRFKAGDGYEVTVPYEIVSEKDIILAYEFNNEPLEEKKQPLRVAIDNVRSMYYVANLKEIEFSKEDIQEKEASNKSILLLETLYSKLPSEDYMYYDSNDKAIKVSDLLENLEVEEVSEVQFIASDGYEKTEDMDVVKDGFIKYTGDDSPLFTGLDLPKGMNVKYIMNMNIGTTCFISVNSYLSGKENIEIEDVKGVSLEEIINSIGIKGEQFDLIADDGYSVTVSSDSIKDAVVYLGETGTAYVKYTKDYPKNMNIKNLMKIQVNKDGEKEETNTNDSEDSKSTNETSLNDWTIVFEGLSDGSFDLTSDKASRKLELVPLHTKRMKNDKIYEDDWEGYKLLDILDFLHVDDFNSVRVIAGDGYEVELTKEQVDEETIIAVTKNGEPLPEDNKVQLVQNTQFATTWVSNIEKIIVN